MLLPETPRGYSLEAVNEFRQRHFGRIFDEQMHMVILAIGLNQNCLKVLADFCKHLTQRFMGGIRQYATTIFGHEDQMHMQTKNAVSSCPKCS
jgi:hypothetical protein